MRGSLIDLGWSVVAGLIAPLVAMALVSTGILPFFDRVGEVVVVAAAALVTTAVYATRRARRTGDAPG
jgi:hypothetical protein